MKQKDKLPNPPMRVPTEEERVIARKFGRFMKESRTGSGVTLVEAAECAGEGWSTMYISAMESGNVLPSHKVLRKLCRKYSVQPNIGFLYMGRVSLSMLNGIDWNVCILAKTLRKCVANYQHTHPRKKQKPTLEFKKGQSVLLESFSRRYKRT